MPNKSKSDIENKAKNELSNLTSTLSSYDEIQDIKQDLDSLKTNVVELTKHLKKDSKVQAEKLTESAREQLRQLKDAGAERFHDVEKYVQDKPGQSLATAFLVGFVASILLARR